MRRIALALAAAALFLPAAPRGARAGGDEGAQPHLDYKRTYAEALLESRIRNVPVLVSRQKDD